MDVKSWKSSHKWRSNRSSIFLRGLKLVVCAARSGTAEAVPFHTTFMRSRLDLPWKNRRPHWMICLRLEYSPWNEPGKDSFATHRRALRHEYNWNVGAKTRPLHRQRSDGAGGGGGDRPSQPGDGPFPFHGGPANGPGPGTDRPASIARARAVHARK